VTTGYVAPVPHDKGGFTCGHAKCSKQADVVVTLEHTGYCDQAQAEVAARIDGIDWAAHVRDGLDERGQLLAELELIHHAGNGSPQALYETGRRRIKHADKTETAKRKSRITAIDKERAAAIADARATITARMHAAIATHDHPHYRCVTHAGDLLDAAGVESVRMTTSG
jgi:hypothetical protein